MIFYKNPPSLNARTRFSSPPRYLHSSFNITTSSNSQSFLAEDSVSLLNGSEIVLSDQTKKLLELLPRIGAPDHHETTHIMLQDGLPFLVFSYAYLGQPFLFFLSWMFPNMALAGAFSTAAEMVGSILS